MDDEPGRRHARPGGCGWNWIILHLVGATVFAGLAVAKALTHGSATQVEGLVFVALIWGIPATMLGGARLLQAFVRSSDD